MLAYCGLVCNTCPIHLATLEPDKSRQHTMRESIAKQCSKQYGMHLQPADITDCDGCRVETGRLFSGCRNCEIRKCASQKDIENCAYCADYACDLLLNFFSHDPDAKIRLDELRQ
jgi:hypothetical protein